MPELIELMESNLSQTHTLRKRDIGSFHWEIEEVEKQINKQEEEVTDN